MKKPEITEITDYLTTEKKYDEFTAMGFAEQFWHFYESKGWMIGKSAMKSWKSAIATWEINKKNESNKRNTAGSTEKLGTSEARMRAARKW